MVQCYPWIESLDSDEVTHQLFHLYKMTSRQTDNQSAVPMATEEELFQALQQQGFLVDPANMTPKAKKEKDRREAEKEWFEALNNELAYFSAFRAQNRIELLQLAVECLQKVRHSGQPLPVIVGPTQSTNAQGPHVGSPGPSSMVYSGFGDPQDHGHGSMGL